MSVSRETVAAVVRRFDVPQPDHTTAAITALLEALLQEPDPPTTVRDPVQALDVHVADSLSGLEVPQLAGAERASQAWSSPPLSRRPVWT
jgi:hypothetical protein